MVRRQAFPRRVAPRYPRQCSHRQSTPPHSLPATGKADQGCPHELSCILFLFPLSYHIFRLRLNHISMKQRSDKFIFSFNLLQIYFPHFALVFCGITSFFYLCSPFTRSLSAHKFDGSLSESAKNCPDGGIGRRAGLKHQCRKACRFDPGSGYCLKSPSRPPFAGEVVLRAHYPTRPRFAVLRTALMRLPENR